MSKFTDQQQTQTNLLALLLMQQSNISDNFFLGFFVTGAAFFAPFAYIPLWIFDYINTRFAVNKARQAILAELHLYESGEVCNSYSHVEIAQLKRRLRELD